MLPKTTKTLTILDRDKECGAVYEPLASDVISALSESGIVVNVVAGRYGLSSKEFTPDMAISVFENANKQKPKNHFVVGIVDDVMNSSLPESKTKFLDKQKITSCVFYGFGSDGTVSANKNSIKIISDEANKVKAGDPRWLK